MDQHSTIFDKDFENLQRPRRRDIMPKWLRIYTLCVMGIGIVFTVWVLFFAPDYAANDPMAANPELGKSYRAGHKIGGLVPGTMFFLMGLFVWLERRRAILFNLVYASLWATLILLLTMQRGPIGLTVGILYPIFVPYWIGLLQIKSKWEKEAVR
jgi:hypothetical protein